MKYQVSRDGDVLGEHEPAEIKALLKDGVYRPSDYFWAKGMAEWKPLTDLVLNRSMTQSTSKVSPWIKWSTLAVFVLVCVSVAWPMVQRSLKARAKANTPYARLQSKVPAEYVVTEKNLAEVTEWAEAGDAVAMALVADALRTDEVERDYKKSFEWAKKSADADCALGSYLLGTSYLDGHATEKDEKKANRLLASCSDTLQLIAATAPEAWKYRAAVALIDGHGLPADSKRGCDTLTQMANKGDARAMWGLAYTLLNETTGDKDETAGCEWLKKAADGGFRTAVLLYATCLADGSGYPADKKTALQVLERLKDAPTPVIYEIAQMVMRRQEPLKDPEVASRWIERAAMRGAPGWMGYWAMRLEAGTGVTKDTGQSREWRMKAAEAGDIQSMIDFGNDLFQGISVSRDESAAHGWWKKVMNDSANLEPEIVGLNAFNIGTMLSDADAPHQDYDEAARYFEMALGDKTFGGGAKVKLARLHADGKIKAANFDKAFSLVSQAAAEDDADAYELLGDLCLAGKGCPQSDDATFRWWMKYADFDAAKTRERLTTLVYRWQGELIKQSKQSLLFKLMFKLAQAGDATAMSVVGEDYDHGVGTDKSPLHAFEWYQRAANAGDIEGMVNAGYKLSKGDGVIQDHAAAAEWFKRAAGLGDATGMNNLANAYLMGTGVPRDYVEAYAWFNLSIASGVNPASGASKAESPRDYVTHFMTRDQIAEAQSRSRQYAEAIERRKKEAEQPKSSSGDPLAKPKTGAATGTGFFVSTEGHFLTNVHVIDQARSIQVRLPNGKSAAARVIRKDAVNDLALLQIDGESLKTTGISLSSAGESAGASVFTMGFPNVLVQGVEPKLTEGSISSTSGIQDDPRFYQISVPIQPGNSGGPLLNKKGEVVGIVQSRLSNRAALAAGGGLPQNVNYALKVSLALPLLDGVPVVKQEGSTAATLEDAAKQAKAAIVLIIAE